MSVPVFTSRPGIILDTDLCTDRDDVLDVAICMALHLRGECELLAIVINSSDTKGAPCARAMLDANGLTSVLVGAYQGNDMDTLSSFTSEVTTRFGNSSDTRANYDTGANILRRALAGRPKWNVRYINTGFAPNLQALLQSAADQYSSLSGSDLFNEKISECHIVAGDYPSGEEYNMQGSPAEYDYFFTNNPGRPVKLWGFTPPLTVLTSPPGSADPLVSPIKYAFDLQNPAARAAWGQFGCLTAVRGVGALFYESGVNGTNSVNSGTGANTWSSTAGNDTYYRKVASDSVIQSTINGLVAEVI